MMNWLIIFNHNILNQIHIIHLHIWMVYHKNIHFLYHKILVMIHRIHQYICVLNVEDMKLMDIILNQVNMIHL